MTTDVSALLRGQLAAAQDHVLAAVDGLDDEALSHRAAPSGWTIAGLLSHLALDVETFWVQAILAGRPEAIAAVGDGWQAVPAEPGDAVTRYRHAVATSREILADADLEAAPAWWPPADVFPLPPYESGWRVCLHVLSEVATHAGQLDLVREAIDGRQHLVVD